MVSVSIRGFRSALRKFVSADASSVSTKHWKVAKGGYDLWFEIYFDNVPVARCVSGELENSCLREEDFYRLAQIVLEEYTTSPRHPLIVIKKEVS